ncbi:hypothetical protein ABW19_dt0207580 [Dactylella cylindrospora]|nr:hypothetical protein ABW19_dt0207580 [Dactylella cylindrospora]
MAHLPGQYGLSFTQIILFVLYAVLFLGCTPALGLPSEITDSGASENSKPPPLEFKSRCFISEFGSNRGPSFDELESYTEFLEPKDAYIIDRVGCFQIGCLGQYGVLRLCNFTPAPSYQIYTPNLIGQALAALFSQFRPESGEPSSCSKYYNRDLDPTLKDNRLTGVAYNSDEGWELAIDPAYEGDEEPVVCDVKNNFVTGACKNDTPVSCSWDYSQPIPGA